MIRSIGRHAVVATLIGAFALSACGSDSDNAATTAAGTVAAGSGATASPATDAAPVATDAPETLPPDEQYPSDGTESGSSTVGQTTAPAAAGGAATLTIKEFKFSDLTVAAGTPITLSNEDGFAHTVTERDALFDVKVEGGTTQSVTIAKAGTYQIFCRIHPSMSGTITVT